jgi:Inosine-uridine preferring nucleoside hydrolase
LQGREPLPRHAVDALLETAGRYPGEVELVTLGPLTNVAMALHKDPSFAEKVKGCVMMGERPPRQLHPDRLASLLDLRSSGPHP